jgi:GTP cyclohydrolase II
VPGQESGSRAGVILLICSHLSFDMTLRGLLWNTGQSYGFDPGIKVSTEHLPMKIDEGSMSPRVFGDAANIGVERALTEIRAGRPVLIQSGGESLMALAVDGVAADRIAAFQGLFHPALPQLVITARRARALGLDVAEPVQLELSKDDDAQSIFALASAVTVERKILAQAAGESAVAAIELAKLVQKLPALLVARVATAASSFDPPLVSVAAAAVTNFSQDLIRSLAIAGEAQVPLQSGVGTRFVVFRDAIGAAPVAIIVGRPDLSRPVPIRVHSACLTGDVFGSRRCDCGDQLQLAVRCLHEAGGGVVLYLEQEGRGLGLANKMRAYELQDGGLDTVDANTTLGFDDDERDYRMAARMLEILGCTRVVMLTNNPGKLDGLAAAGIEISGRIPLNTPINADNRRYLAALAKRAGHLLDGVLAGEGEPEVGAAHLRPERPS